MLSFDETTETMEIDMQKKPKKKHVKKILSADKGKEIKILNCKPEGNR